MPIEKPFLHKKAWSATFKGWSIAGCAIRKRDMIYLVLRKELSKRQQDLRDHDIPTRLVALYPDRTDPKEQWSHQGVEGFSHPVCGAAIEPIAQGMIAGMNGNVLALGSGLLEMEHIEGEDGAPPGLIRKLRTINGHVYAVGLFREVFRRDGVGEWTRLDAKLPPVNDDDVMDSGFLDIDGFSNSDIYAAGGKGDVWHYDGKSWASCDFPFEINISNVCCAGDGHVYLFGEGNVYCGKKKKWEIVCESGVTQPGNDMRWFDEKLWISSSFSLVKQLVGNELQYAEADGEHVSGNHIDAGDGVLVVANETTVRLFDGENWRVLVAPY